MLNVLKKGCSSFLHAHTKVGIYFVLRCVDSQLHKHFGHNLLPFLPSGVIRYQVNKHVCQVVSIVQLQNTISIFLQVYRNLEFDVYIIYGPES